MRSINSSSNKRLGAQKIIFIGIASLLLLCGVLFYTETHHITNFFLHKSSADNMTPQQKEEATKNDPTTASNSAKSDAQPAPGVNHSQTTSQVPVSTSSSVAITNLNEVNGTINLTAIITNPASSGVCTVTFTKSGAKPVTRTINTTTNTCSTAISAQEFSMIGDWQAQVIYFANNTQASATGAITIK